jgi:hypothetical protein
MLFLASVGLFFFFLQVWKHFSPMAYLEELQDYFILHQYCDYIIPNNPLTDNLICYDIAVCTCC